MIAMVLVALGIAGKVLIVACIFSAGFVGGACWASRERPQECDEC